MCYPTEEQLKVIENFDLTKRPVKELLDLVIDCWHEPDWGFEISKHKLELHTGGWSGNEDIIAHLAANWMFWNLYWKSSQRGGHYVFNDRMVAKDLKGFL